VFGYLGQSMSADAEYFCMPENGRVTTKPANMTFDEVAVAPYGAIMALNLLRKVYQGGLHPERRDLPPHLRRARQELVDRRFPQEQLAEAHRQVESGQKRRQIVITVAA